MNKTYLITFNDKSCNKTIFVNSETALKPEEIESLKKRRLAIQTIASEQIHQSKKAINIQWKDLEAKTFSAVDDKTMIVTEVASAAIKQLQGPALITRLETLADSWPSEIPLISLIWYLILAPLMLIGWFLGRNRDGLIHSLKDLDEKFDYDNSNHYLKEYTHHLQLVSNRLENQDKEKIKEVKAHLDEMKTNGEILLKSLENPNNTLHEVAETFTKKIKTNYTKAKPTVETLLLSFSMGIYKEGKFQPMLATITTRDNKFRLDLNPLGNPSFEHLQTSYQFDQALDDASIKELIHGLCVLSTPTQPADPINLTYREKTRVKVLRQFDASDSAKSTNDKSTFNAEQWLHEKICTLKGIPLKSTEEKPSSKCTLEGIISSNLNRFFKEVPKQEKIAFLMQLVEDHYETYMQALPYLTEAQQERQLQLLKFKMKKLEDHLLKRMSPEDLEGLKSTNQSFEAFFKKMDQIEKSRQSVEKNRRLNKAVEIDVGLKKDTGSYVLAPKTSHVVPLAASLNDQEADEGLKAFEVNLGALAEQIKLKNVEETLKCLETIQKDTDQLIDKKKYATAKQLSLRALALLPTPTIPVKVKDPFWPLSGNKNSIIQITKLNQHIWESALRLKESTPEPTQLLQMMKSQFIICRLSGNSQGIRRFVDTNEMLDVLLLHPHFRYGWLPEQQNELNQIVDLVKHYQEKQYHTSDRLDQLLEPLIIQEADDFDQACHKAIGRVQCMMTCLLKPDSTLYPFYAMGSVGQATGINYLDTLAKESINRGAKTEKEKSDMIKALKYADIQRRLDNMGRLEIVEGTRYVTEKPCIKIADRSFFGREALAYFTHNPWLPFLENFEKKYRFSNTQDNSRPLVGKVRGEELYLHEQDGDIIDSGDKQRSSGIVGTLTKQSGVTEPSLLKQNLQIEPKGQISQMSNYLLESVQVTKQSRLSSQTIYEALNLLRTQSHLLGDPEFQRTLLLAITHPSMLIEAIKENPLYFDLLAKEMHALIQSRSTQQGVVPFLIFLGDLLTKHMIEAKKSTTQPFPTYSSQIQINDKKKTGLEWLRLWMADPEKDAATVALSLVYGEYNRLNPLTYSPEELAQLVHAAKIFMSTGDSIGVPLFNAEIKKWIRETLTPHIQNKCQGDQPEEISYRNAFLNYWMRLTINNLTYSSLSWKKDKEGLIENEDFKLNLNNLEIKNSNPLYPLEGLKIQLPQQVAKSIAPLFGTEPIKATLHPGKTINENNYEFQYKEYTYSVSYNQESSAIAIYSKLPVNLQSKNSTQEWYQYVSHKTEEGKNFSAIEHLIKKNGLFIRTSNPRQAYLFSHKPLDGIKENPYFVEIDKKGTISRISDPVKYLTVVLDQQQKLQDTVPFAHAEDTIFLKPSSGLFAYRATEIRFLKDESILTRKKRGEWHYAHKKLGDGYRWLTDLSDEKLLFKERSSAKAFLNSLGSMQEQFVLCLTNDKTHTFVLQPYPIVKHKGTSTIQFDQKNSILPPNVPPLTITFDAQGKMEGNPSAFLYLAYYFSQMKNYKLANRYLELSQKAANSSPEEARVIEALEQLLEQSNNSSIRETTFQLRAHLAIKAIKTKQLSQTVYEPENSERFLDNLQHIHKLYSHYCEHQTRIKENPLTETELYDIKSYVQMSMRCYVEKYKQAKGVVEGSLDVDFKQFRYFREPDKFTESTDILSMLLMSDLNAPNSIDELVKPKTPDANYVVRNFFNFIIAICELKTDKSRKQEDLEKIKLFLKSPKNWELFSSQNDEERNYVELAKLSCHYLQRLIESNQDMNVDLPDPYLNAKTGGVILTPVSELRNSLLQYKKILPYWDRSFGLLSTFIDVERNTMAYVAYVKKSMQLLLKQLINLSTSAEVKTVRGNFDKTQIGKNMTSLQAVYDVVTQDKPDFLTPLELSEIPRMIREEKSDMNKPEELITLLRGSEALGISFLEIRHEKELTEKMRMLEKQVTERKIYTRSQTPYIFEKATLDVSKIKKDLPALKVAIDDPQYKQRLQKLDEKKKQIEAYYKPKSASKTHNEEYAQILLGLENAAEKITLELQYKTTFTKSEITALKKEIENQVITLGKQEATEREALIQKIKKLHDLPPSLKEMYDNPEIYTEYDLFNEILRVIKDPELANRLETCTSEITSYLFLYTTYLQFKKAQESLRNEPSSPDAVKALLMIDAALNEKRFAEAGITDLYMMRICLVAEAREGIIYRKAQLEAIVEITKNPNKWVSLIMGIGKTTYIVPTISETIALQGKFVVLTVPENLLKGNRQTADKTSRSLFDQAGVEFILPLAERLPHNYLLEKYLQLLQVVKEKGYVMTSVEELCTLHNMIIQLEDDKEKLLKNSNADQMEIVFIEKRLHFLRKISQLIHGEAPNLNVTSQFFGDEVDGTHNISKEVNLAAGEKDDPNKKIRDVTRTLFEIILQADDATPLGKRKKRLLSGEQSVYKPEELNKFMQECAAVAQTHPLFLKLLDDDFVKLIRKLNSQQWQEYLTGTSDKMPSGLPKWDEKNLNLQVIAAAKQILSHTMKGMFSLKSGNDFGFSDYKGFLSVPKVTKNETEGMNFGDEFELILAQYLAQLEFSASKSLTDSSEEFFELAIKLYKNKYPSKYDKIIEEYANSQKGQVENKHISLLDYLKSPEAWKHRFAILDEIVFEGGYIKRFKQQISTKVQEVFVGKNCGGVTGTLDPYTLPFITETVQFNEENKKCSTRDVEAETLLRLTLNLDAGIDTKVSVYDDRKPLEHVCEQILKSTKAKAFVNNSGATSEGLDMIAWVETLRKTPEGKSRTYLFLHPTFRMPYLWLPDATQPIAYKNQKLPNNCIILYGVSDTRGVDFVIPEGEVHVFIAAAAPLQEVMQTLYRARDIGRTQKIVLHIPKSWSEQIIPTNKSGISYGDVFKYVVDRTVDTKEGINEAAQLEKVLGRLKAIVSQHLRKTRPEYDNPNFWDRQNITKFQSFIQEESAFFKKIKDLYIIEKKIDFESIYEPLKKTSGTKKIEEAYDDLIKMTKDLLNTEFSTLIAQLDQLLQEDKELESFQPAYQFVESLGKKPNKSEQEIKFCLLIDNHFKIESPKALEELKSKLREFARNNNMEHFCDQEFEKLPSNQFEALLQLLGVITSTVKNTPFENDVNIIVKNVLNPEVKLLKNLLQEALKLDTFNSDLKKLIEDMENEKLSFIKKADKHENFLPKETTKSRTGSKGVKEQVKELQKTKTQAKQVEDDDPSVRKHFDDHIKRSYAPLSFNDLFNKRYIPLNAPFEDLQISTEANEIMKLLSVHKGDSILYLVMTKTSPTSTPQLTLVSKQDYTQVIFPSLRQLSPQTKNECYLFSINPNGFSQIDGTKKFEGEIPINFQAAKCYLGMKEYEPQEVKKLKEWVRTLSTDQQTKLKQFIKDKATNPLYELIFS